MRGFSGATCNGPALRALPVARCIPYYFLAPSGTEYDMSRKFAYSWPVARWLGDVEIEVKNVPASVVMALIHVESSGDPSARKSDKSQFYGLLQAGRAVGIDVGMRDMGRETSRKLNGDGPAALRTFSALVHRYEERCRDADGNLDPLRVALLWKAGAGFVRDVNALLTTGVEWDEAIDMVAEVKGFSPVEYLEWFKTAHGVWSNAVCGRA